MSEREFEVEGMHYTLEIDGKEVYKCERLIELLMASQHYCGEAKCYAYEPSKFYPSGFRKIAGKLKRIGDITRFEMI